MNSIHIDNPFYLNAHLPLDFVEEYCNESFDDGYFSCKDDDYFEDVDSETPDLVADEGLYAFGRNVLLFPDYRGSQIS